MRPFGEEKRGGGGGGGGGHGQQQQWEKVTDDEEVKLQKAAAKKAQELIAKTHQQLSRSVPHPMAESSNSSSSNHGGSSTTKRKQTDFDDGSSSKRKQTDFDDARATDWCCSSQKDIDQYQIWLRLERGLSLEDEGEEAHPPPKDATQVLQEWKRSRQLAAPSTTTWDPHVDAGSGSSPLANAHHRLTWSWMLRYPRFDTCFLSLCPQHRWSSPPKTCMVEGPSGDSSWYLFWDAGMPGWRRRSPPTNPPVNFSDVILHEVTRLLHPPHYVDKGTGVSWTFKCHLGYLSSFVNDATHVVAAYQAHSSSPYSVFVDALGGVVWDPFTWLLERLSRVDAVLASLGALLPTAVLSDCLAEYV